jgi:diguanylate cyclase (GGDEF)-like protein
MLFPLIKDLVTRNVTVIDIDFTLQDTLELMYRENHRSVVICSGRNFFIITASDLLKLKLKEFDFSKSLSTIRLTELPIIDKEQNILEAISFLEQSTEYICTLNRDGSFYGLLTHSDIISSLDPETLIDNYRIYDLINMKKDLYKVSDDTDTSYVLEDMINLGYDCAVIVDDDKPIGILTTKDVMKLLKIGSDLKKPVSEYMTTPIETLNEDSTIKSAVVFMNQKHYKRIVVVDDNLKLKALILQRELISLSYSRWALLMKKHSHELSQINELLEKRTKKYEYLASTDQLTKLPNRYKFTDSFIKEYENAILNGTNLSLALIDIDYFKKINDTYGHDVGDTVLIKISKFLHECKDKGFSACRWGGEEFAILLPNLDVAHSKDILNGLKEKIYSSNILEDRKVSISIGVTQVVLDGEKLEDVIKRADIALYKAKDSGRNSIQLN